MTQGIEFLELIYGQLHEAGFVRSKGEFSERLLGKSPSYLTSMREFARCCALPWPRSIITLPTRPYPPELRFQSHWRAKRPSDEPMAS